MAIEDFPLNFTEKQIAEVVGEGLDEVKNKGLASYSIILKKSQLTPYLEDQIISLGLEKVDTRYYYTLDLLNKVFSINNQGIILKNLTEIKEDLFLKVWEESTFSSLNGGESSSIEKTYLGLQEELGPNYKIYCNLGFIKNKPIGVTIPHLEPGTDDEGRLFYFGLLSHYRGRGLGAPFHLASLTYLKKLGMVTYIGATGEKNLPMQRIFKSNGCHKFDERITFKLK